MKVVSDEIKKKIKKKKRLEGLSEPSFPLQLKGERCSTNDGPPPTSPLAFFFIFLTLLFYYFYHYN